MANRYANLIGTNKIRDEYPKINQAFDTVQQEVDALEADIEALDEKLDTIILNPIEGEVAAQEVVLARGNADTLPKRLDGIESDLNIIKSNVALKADKSEVRMKSVKIELEDMSAETLAAMSGTATFNLESVPQDGSVTPAKLDNSISKTFSNRDVTFVYGVNLFNPNTALVDTVLNSSGDLSAYIGWSTSDFIDVGSNKSVFIPSPRFVAEYDVFNNLIPGTFVDNTSRADKLFVTNEKTRYIRFTRETSTIETAMVMLGTSATTRRYPFSGKAILKQKDGSELYVDNVVNNRYEIKSGGKNLFDKNRVTLDALLVPNGKTTSPAIGWITSDFIEVPQESIVVGQVRSIHEYDKYFEPVVDSYVDLGTVVPNYSFTPKSNTKYFRFSYYSTSTPIQVEVGSVATAYEEHYYSVFVDGKKVYDLIPQTVQPVIEKDLSVIDYSKVNLKQVDLMSIFASDEGWTDVGGVGIMENDAVNFTYGSQSIKTSVSDGNYKSIQKPISANIKDSIVVLKIYVENIDNVESLQIFFGNEGFTDYYGWYPPVARLKTGWNVITESTSHFSKRDANTPDNLLENVKTLRVCQKAKASVVSTISFDAIGTAENAIQKGKICIMFDDGFNGVWNYAKPALDKYGFRAVVPVIRDLIGTSSFMTMEQLKILYDNGWDIVTHGQRDLTTMTREQLATELDYNKQILIDNGFVRSAKHYVSHQGRYNDLALEEIKKRFITHRTTEFRYVTLPVADKYRLGNVGGNNADINQLKVYADTAEKNKVVAMINWHQIVESSATGNEGIASVFREFVDYIASKNVDVVTLSDIFNPYD